MTHFATSGQIFTIFILNVTHCNLYVKFEETYESTGFSVHSWNKSQFVHRPNIAVYFTKMFCKNDQL